MCFFKPKLKTYSQADLQIVTNHIIKTFGPVNRKIKETESKYVERSIFICNPTEQRPYYILTTLGMGADVMRNMPPSVKNEGYGRAELIIYLPKNWDFQNREEETFWPISYLRALMRYPFIQQTWIGYGHTMQLGGRLPGTDFKGLLFDYPHYFNKSVHSVELKNGELVWFYQLIPLYSNEIVYKNDESYEHLKKLLKEDYGILNPHRINVLTKLPKRPRPE